MGMLDIDIYYRAKTITSDKRAAATSTRVLPDALPAAFSIS